MVLHRPVEPARLIGDWRFAPNRADSQFPTFTAEIDLSSGEFGI